MIRSHIKFSPDNYQIKLLNTRDQSNLATILISTENLQNILSHTNKHVLNYKGIKDAQ